MSLSRRIRDIFDAEGSEPIEKRAIINFLLSNLTVTDRKLTFSLRKPFDTLLDLAHHPTQLPDLDSNQDEWIQSPLSYH